MCEIKNRREDLQSVPIEMTSNINDFKNWSLNDYADFWRYEVGVNVIPADTKNKRPKVEWKHLQNKPIPEELYTYWKREDMFKDGLMIITGKVWHNHLKKKLFLNCVDLDNEIAIKEFCNIKGEEMTLKEVADMGHVIVEQHADDPARAHIFVWSTSPFRKKNSSISVADSLSVDVPKIEVKGEGNDSLVSVTPSPHKDGSPYKFIGNSVLAVTEPKIHNEIEEHINAICESYGIEYLNREAYRNGKLFNPKQKIQEGSRHDYLLRYADSTLRRLHQTTPTEAIKRIVQYVNMVKCDPPLNEQEIDQIWHDSLRFISTQVTHVDMKSNDKDNNNDSRENREQEKNRTKRIDCIMDFIENQNNILFVDEYQTPYTTISIDDHLELIQINSKKFKNWLAGTYYKKSKQIIDSTTLNDVIGVLNAKAFFDSSKMIRLNLRVAERQDCIAHGGPMKPNSTRVKWYFDLTNKLWEFVEITSEGWNIVKSNNSDLVLFRRFNNQLPQVYPSNEYESNIFDRFVKLLLNKNISDENNRSDYELLLKCYIVSLFIPEIPKPVLMPHGHQGSAKSTIFESIKLLADPSIVKTLSIPRDVNELIQQLSHNHLACYDNVSGLRDWMSDQICRAVTGSGSSKRELYTNDDDIIYSFKRCIAINGINLAATKPDLLDRGLVFHLKRIEKVDRLKEQDIKKEVESMIPGLLGYIFDVLVKVLKFKWTTTIELKEYPRMADFAEYGEIIARCMGYKENNFLAAYYRNIDVQVDEIIDSSQVAACLMYMMYGKYGEKGGDFRPEWDGTASALVGEFKAITDSDVGELNIDTKNKYWPKNANVLRKRLNELAPTLKEAGLQITFYRSPDRRRTRRIKICKLSSEPVDSSAKGNSLSKLTKNTDATTDANETAFQMQS